MKRFSPQWLAYQWKHHPASVRLWSDRSLHLVGVDRPAGQRITASLPFKRNDWDDLTCFQQTERWLSRDAFLAMARERLDEGIWGYTLAEDGVLLYYAWVRHDVPRSVFPYVGQTVAFPPHTATSYAGYVHPKGRGRGLFTEGLRHFLGDTFNHTGSQRLFAGVEGHNRAALRCHEQAGFTHVATLSTQHRLGSATSSGALEPDHVGLALTADGPGRWTVSAPAAAAATHA